MSPAGAIAVFLAGIGGGLSGSVAGLASLVTFPALLAVGLPPLTANITNTVGLVGSSAGAILGSRPELHGRRAWLRALVAAGALGGAVGGGLLLVTPEATFEAVVPWLVAVGAVAVLLRRRLVDDEVAGAGADARHPQLLWVIGLIGVYAGYFGAGAGVLILAALLHTTADSVPHCAAAKNVVLGAANGVAALAFVVLGAVDWPRAAVLGAGAFLGGQLGPRIVRRSDPARLRMLIAMAGLGLAVKLGISAYA